MGCCKEHARVKQTLEGRRLVGEAVQNEVETDQLRIHSATTESLFNHEELKVGVVQLAQGLRYLVLDALVLPDKTCEAGRNLT